MEAVDKLWQERKEMGHTPLVKFQPKGFPNLDIIFKNETASKTHTLKHRFAWALLMWMISEGKVNSKSTVYDATSGNTGASEAYMCKLVGLPFTAVVSTNLEPEKLNQITSHDGKIIKTDASLRIVRAQEEAEKNNGFFTNQDGNAMHAEDIHESGNYTHESTNVFHEILQQLREDDTQQKKIPDYFVHSAGTGGTISSVGRYAKRYNIPTKILLADSEYSIFHDYVLYNKFTNETGTEIWKEPGIAGIGAGYDVKPLIHGNTTRSNPNLLKICILTLQYNQSFSSLTSSVVDESMKMPDIASVAAMHVLRERGIGGGASTALNFLVSLHKAYQLKDSKNVSGRLTIATILGDPSGYYESTYFNPDWINRLFADRGGMKGVNCWKDAINNSIDTGSDFLEEGLAKCSDNASLKLFR
ncbi:pyridoxal-phosphate dependent protein [Oesophagostomum dentatum]|uniref:Pyridoxal-phosphate dependent protein n=1 Tax=Oesophagostomum dentatum TaxID=61180 RepID=A0A0B1T640_OESDE|nr:pyridoxal-phosphate dependent protein [Oesophagostomum dentatum]